MSLNDVWHGFERRRLSRRRSARVGLKAAGRSRRTRSIRACSSPRETSADAESLFTRKGYSWYRGSARRLGKLGSSTSFLRLHVTGNVVVPLAERVRFLFRSEYGAIDVDELSRLPPSQRFFAGGDRSVRGYRYEKLGPTDTTGAVVGGRYLVTANAEVDYLFFRNYGAAVFYDAGNAANEPWPDVKRSVGIGHAVAFARRHGADRHRASARRSRHGLSAAFEHRVRLMKRALVKSRWPWASIALAGLLCRGRRAALGRALGERIAVRLAARRAAIAAWRLDRHGGGPARRTARARWRSRCRRRRSSFASSASSSVGIRERCSAARSTSSGSTCAVVDVVRLPAEQPARRASRSGYPNPWPAGGRPGRQRLGRGASLPLESERGTVVDRAREHRGQPRRGRARTRRARRARPGFRHVRRCERRTAWRV